MNIIKNRKKFFTVSILVILAGIISMIINASAGRGIFNFDIEFTGGTSMVLDIGKDFNNNDIITIIDEVTGQKSPQVQRIGNSNEVMIKMQSIDGEMRTEVVKAISDKYGLTGNPVLESSDISATVSGEMQKDAILAVIVACTAMLVYISIRFRDFRAGASAILALFHDVSIVLAFYAMLRIPVNNSFIAAILTILGYSINATIVIFDRVRENKDRFRKNQLVEKIDKSINQTMGRSINTTLTTLFTITAIYILGVPSVKEFALPLIIGIACGAYSSIFLSGSFWYILIPKSEK